MKNTLLGNEGKVGRRVRRKTEMSRALGLKICVEEGRCADNE